MHAWQRCCHIDQPAEGWHAAACLRSYPAAPARGQVRRWDVESGAATDTLNASKAVYCVAAPPRDASGAGLVAFGGAERVLRLWDPRTAPGEALVRGPGAAGHL
jgi:WD40 repeat protein